MRARDYDAGAAACVRERGAGGGGVKLKKSESGWFLLTKFYFYSRILRTFARIFARLCLHPSCLFGRWQHALSCIMVAGKGLAVSRASLSAI